MASETDNAGGWATIEEAAKYASVSSEIVEEWLANGLDYYEITSEKLIRIKYSDIDNYMGRFRKTKSAKPEISTEVREKKEKVIETVKNVKRKMALYPQEKKPNKEDGEDLRGHLSVTNPKTNKKFLIPRSRLAGKEHARIKDPDTGEVLLFDTKTGDIIMRYGSKKDAPEPDENDE